MQHKGDYMANTKPCKICGKEFTPCSTQTVGFNWRKVACCQEHGAMYLERVLRARGELDKSECPKIKKETGNKNVNDEIIIPDE